MILRVDKEKCEACEECVDVCPSGVFKITNGVSEPINIGECVECCACVETCPNEAIIHNACA
jgi:NAD-dependent dihydropyrimidine dehydrogenase PreA subunit